MKVTLQHPHQTAEIYVEERVEHVGGFVREYFVDEGTV
jgi:hypothetical protein